MPTNRPSLRLAEVLAARLCHDLASPLGAFSGVIELAEETGDLTVLADARAISARLSGQLRLLRAAWAADPAPLSVSELEAFARDMAGHRRISMDLSGLARDQGFGAEAGRSVLNLLLLGVEAVGGEGTLHLSGAPAREVVLRIAGARATWPAGMVSCLLAPGEAWAHATEPRALQMPLTVLLAAQAGFHLSLLMPLTAATGAVPPLLLRFD